MNIIINGKTLKFALGDCKVPVTRNTDHPAIKLNRQGCYYGYAVSPDLFKGHIGYWPTYESAVAAFNKAEQLLKEDYALRGNPEPPPY